MQTVILSRITVACAMITVELEITGNQVSLRTDYGTYGRKSWNATELQMFARITSNYASLIPLVKIGSAIAQAINARLEGRDSRFTEDEAEIIAQWLVEITEGYSGNR